MTKDIEREAFEEWIKSNYPISKLELLEKHSDGGYQHRATRNMFDAWQAAKAYEAEKSKGCVMVPEWISTRDYLPDEGVEVLVHRYGQIFQATKDKGYAGGFKERNCYGWQATFDVTYWMPKNFKLPDGYSFYYNDEHPYRETMLEAARGGNE